jgi:hypothetical protein
MNVAVPAATMRVTRQLMHGVIATTLLVGVVNGTLRVMREQRTMADDTQRDHAFVGRTLRSAYAAFPDVAVRVRQDGPCLAHDGERSFVEEARFVSCYPLRAPDGVRRALVVSESLPARTP